MTNVIKLFDKEQHTFFAERKDNVDLYLLAMLPDLILLIGTENTFDTIERVLDSIDLPYMESSAWKVLAGVEQV